MKNVLIVFTVLAMASVANAALTAGISVNGVVDRPDYGATDPRTDPVLLLKPSDIVVIDIHAWNDVSAAMTILLMQGPGSISKVPDSWVWEQSKATIPSAFYADYLAAFTDMGYTNITQIADLDIVDMSEPFTIPNGLVIDGISFHCEGLGDVTLTLMDAAGGVLDTQVIHQIPEPITFALLGLGGLFLRRRK